MNSPSAYAPPKTTHDASEVSRHSKLGIASTILAIFGALAVMIAIGVSGYLEITTPGGIDEDSEIVMMLGAGLVLSALLLILAIVLGAVALAETGKSKAYPLVGILVPVCTIVFTGLLMWAGSTV